MTIDISTDRSGTALRTLVFQALKAYSTEALLPLLRDTDSIVRTAAARQLQLRGEAVVFDHAQKLASSSRKNDREIAAFILGQLGAPDRPFKGDSLPVLQTLCTDRSAEVREAAVAALGHLRAIEAIKVIQRLKRDADEDVQKMAVYVDRQLRAR